MKHEAGSVRLARTEDPRGVAALLHEALPGGVIFLLADRRVNRLHGTALVDALEDHGREVVVSTVPSGERSKSLRSAERLWGQLLDAGISRQDTIVAFGGGVVGDLAGFIASTVLRGVRWAQVPTTILAMADASIGGKTGINTRNGKNLVGSFHMPEITVIAPSWLSTLPSVERRSGLAEIVKSAWLEGVGPVEQLELQLKGELHPSTLAEIAWDAGRFKANLVAEDFLESGRRVLLNFGHTFGHAIEASAGYGAWRHGEAVAMGMVMVQSLAADLGLSSSTVRDGVARTCLLAGLPVEPPVLEVETWMRYLRQDKKKNATGCRFVMLVSAGEYLTPTLSWGEVEEWLRARSH